MNALSFLSEPRFPLGAALLLSLLEVVGGTLGLPAWLGVTAACLGTLSVILAFVLLARRDAALLRAAAVCQAVAEGRLEARVLDAPAQNATGKLQQALNRALDITDAFVREAGGASKAASDGRFHRKVVLRGLPGAFRQAAEDINHAASHMEARAREFAAFVDDFERNVGGVVEGVTAAATSMRSNAETMSGTAERTSSQASAAATATHEAAASTQTMAAAAQQLSASVGEITRQVGRASRIARAAVSAVEHTNVTVAGLDEAARQVGDVVRLISDIAGQTNLLALNATIEAARAGEAGKGFSVVASEVKGLAAQTARATEQIGIQISAMQQATLDAVQAIATIGSTVRETDEVATAIAAAVEQQGSATTEIARSVERASHGTTEVARNIEGVRGAAGDTDQAATALRGAAVSLSGQAEKLAREVAGFMAKARAA
jgi:methyl-accepting chemotaxis protein